MSFTYFHIRYFEEFSEINIHLQEIVPIKEVYLAIQTETKNILCNLFHLLIIQIRYLLKIADDYYVLSTV